MREVYLEGRLMTDRAAAHAEIKNKLSLPEYYGANLDALWDCLIEIGEETVITVCHPGAMLSALREYGCRLLMTFLRQKKKTLFYTLSLGPTPPTERRKPNERCSFSKRFRSWGCFRCYPN